VKIVIISCSKVQCVVLEDKNKELVKKDVTDKVRKYDELFEYFSKIYRNHSSIHFQPLPLAAMRVILSLYGRIRSFCSICL
jgi:hypothetical protein